MSSLPPFLKLRSNGSYEVQKRVAGKVKTKRLGKISFEEAKGLRWQYIAAWEESVLIK